MNIAELVERSLSLVEAGNFQSGLSGFEQALQAGSPFQCYVHYNLAVTHQMVLGNGEPARQHLLYAIDRLGAGKGHLPLPVLTQIHSNTCENMLFSSLSFDEFEEWARRLAQLQPDSDAVRTQLPRIRDMQAQGLPSADVMLQTALAYAGGDPSRPVGRYGNAASIYDLLLRNRRQVGLLREDYRTALIRFAALKSMIFSNCGLKLEKSHGRADPADFRLVLDGIHELLDGY